MSQSPEFHTVFRGYDPIQVDQHLQGLSQTVQAAHDENARLSVELTKATQAQAAALEELDRHRAAIESLKSEQRKVSSPTFADLGERIGSMLGLADEEARSMREGAAADAAQKAEAAEKRAKEVRDAADLYAAEVRSKADVDASGVLEKARLEADSILDDAGREAAARREEAEAYFENQRARAAAAAADFEATLSARRDKAAADFTAQMAVHDAALSDAQEKAARLAKEADDHHASRTAEAERVLEDARAQAASVIDAAREQAERIRRDSERELAAATARRDSITAQLSNVRNMLATLGGGSAVLTEEILDGPAEPAQPAAGPAADEAGEDRAADEPGEGGEATQDADEATEGSEGDRGLGRGPAGRARRERCGPRRGGRRRARAGDQGWPEGPRQALRGQAPPRSSGRGGACVVLEELADGVPDGVGDLRLGRRSDVDDVPAAAAQQVDGRGRPGRRSRRGRPR